MCDTCTNCGSTNTIGIGTHLAPPESQHRRFCKSCSKVYISKTKPTEKLHRENTKHIRELADECFRKWDGFINILYAFKNEELGSVVIVPGCTHKQARYYLRQIVGFTSGYHIYCTAAEKISRTEGRVRKLKFASKDKLQFPEKL